MNASSSRDPGAGQPSQVCGPGAGESRLEAEVVAGESGTAPGQPGSSRQAHPDAWCGPSSDAAKAHGTGARSAGDRPPDAATPQETSDDPTLDDSTPDDDSTLDDCTPDDCTPDDSRRDGAQEDCADASAHPVERLASAEQRQSGEPAGGSPGGLPRVGIVLLILAGAWLAVSAVQQLQNIVAPLLLTLNLVIVAYPVQSRLNRMGLPRIVGAVVSAVIVFSIVLAFFASLGWSMAMLVQVIPSYQQQFSALYQSAVDQLARVGVSETQAMSQLQAELNPSRVLGFATQTLSGLTGALTMLLVTVTIIFVVLIDSMQLERRLQIASRAHADVVAALVGFARGVRRYWIVSSIFGAIVAALDVVALVYLGVPLALVWGLLSFLTNYIPNIGFILGIVPPTVMALLANGPRTALLVVVAYCIINFIIQSIIMPKYLGDAVGVTATVSLLSLLFWAWVLGPLGALLALPATLLSKALLVDLDPRMRWLDAFIASRPEGANQLERAAGRLPR